MNSLEVIVLTKDLEPLGPVNRMTALRWTKRFAATGDFELWCPLTEENAKLLKEDNLIWIGTDSLGVIETSQKTKGTDGKLGLQVSGRFNEVWLARRIVWDRVFGTDKVSNFMRTMVYNNAVNPSITARKLPHIVLQEDAEVKGPEVDYSANKDNLWSALTELGAAHWLSPRLFADVPNKTCIFTVLSAEDRSTEQTENDPVVLSSELSDILSSEYTSDITNYKNMALIAGQGEGVKRKIVTINSSLEGLGRRELYVDARDVPDTEPWDYTKTVEAHIVKTERDDNNVAIAWLVKTTTTKNMTNQRTGETKTEQSSSSTWETDRSEFETGIISTETGVEEVPLPDDVYAAMLAERGRAKLNLAENARIQAFNSQVRMQGARAYTYGVDYFLGDRITVEDTDLMIRVSTEITEVEQAWDVDGYSVILTLGQSAPTITQLIRKD